MKSATTCPPRLAHGSPGRSRLHEHHRVEQEGARRRSNRRATVHGLLWPVFVQAPATDAADGVRLRAVLAGTGVAADLLLLRHDGKALPRPRPCRPRILESRDGSRGGSPMVGPRVGFQSGRDQWMSEGFAELSASLYVSLIEKNPKKFLDFWNDERELLLERNAQGFRAIDAGPLVSWLPHGQHQNRRLYLPSSCLSQGRLRAAHDPHDDVRHARSRRRRVPRPSCRTSPKPTPQPRCLDRRLQGYAREAHGSRS